MIHDAIPTGHDSRPGSHYWDNYPGVLSTSPGMKLIGRFSTSGFNLPVQGTGAYKTIFLHSTIFLLSHNCLNTVYLLSITIIFDRCHRSWAAVTPVKYGRYSRNQTSIFAKSKMSLMEKLTALVTPTHNLQMSCRDTTTWQCTRIASSVINVICPIWKYTSHLGTGTFHKRPSLKIMIIQSWKWIQMYKKKKCDLKYIQYSHLVFQMHSMHACFWEKGFDHLQETDQGFNAYHAHTLKSLCLNRHDQCKNIEKHVELSRIIPNNNYQLVVVYISCIYSLIV